MNAGYLNTLKLIIFIVYLTRDVPERWLLFIHTYPYIFLYFIVHNFFNTLLEVQSALHQVPVDQAFS